MLSLIALQLVHPTVAPNSSMSCLVILLRRIRAPSNGNGGVGIGSTGISGPYTVHLLLQFYVLDGFFVPSALRFESSDFTSFEYAICIPSETFCIVVSHSKQNSELVSGIHQFMGYTEICCANTFLSNGTNSCVFQMAPSRHDPFDIWTRCILHIPPTTLE